MRAHDDERRARRLGDRRARGLLEDVEVVRPVADVDDVPAVGGEALGGVVAQREFGRAVDGDVVVVVEDGQTIESESPGQLTPTRG